MKIAIPKEIEPGERRVAATPETVKKMAAAGFAVALEAGAGEGSAIADSKFETAGTKVVSDLSSLYAEAEIVLKVRGPVYNEKIDRHEADLLREGSVLIGLLQAKTNPYLVSELAKRKVTAFSLDLVPRIARAQKMDILTSQSNIAGYKAVIMAAERLKRMMPLMMTAAGTITPAKVLILGAGVAGLQAIATAKRLGAVVEAFDTRPVVKEQVESLGAKFIAIEIAAEETKGGYAQALSEEIEQKERELITQHVQEADMVITTALIPGKPAPLLITEEAVRGMSEGSVIIDLAAEQGGNCALTEKGKEVVKSGVTIVGLVDLPSLVATDASQLYARNLMNFLFELCPKGQLQINLQDEVIRETLVTHEGKILIGKEPG
jgi:NAD(P) transhydrogenase subunit alpha